MASSFQEEDYFGNALGVPSHFLLFQAVWLNYCTAARLFGIENHRSERGEIDDIILQRAQARLLALDVLLDSLLELAIENDWPIPEEIEIDRIDPIEEGQ
jgi:hypothetical protein